MVFKGILHFSVYTFLKVAKQLLEYQYASKLVALIATMYSINRCLDKRYIVLYKRTKKMFFSSFCHERCIHAITPISRSSVIS
jgi:hypothetical protein